MSILDTRPTRRRTWLTRYVGEGPSRPDAQLRRDGEGRLIGGVAAGVAAWRGCNVTTVRIAFVLVSLISTGLGITVYVAAWLFLPATSGAGSQIPDRTGKPGPGSIASRARTDATGLALAAGLATLMAVLLLVIGVFNTGWQRGWAWPQVLTVAFLCLIWRNGDPADQAVLRRFGEPVGTATAKAAAGHRARWRIVLALTLIIGGASWLASVHAQVALLRPLSAVFLVLAGFVMLLGPWWLRIARDLTAERQARIRAEERAEMAARVHDSVLQTLALIQRRSGDPQQVVQLARAQERDLRSALFGGAPGLGGTGAGGTGLDATRNGEPASAVPVTVAAGLRRIQDEVEQRYGVPVEVVTVGDRPLDERLAAQLAAAREAMINAAKWSGAPVISVFAEVEPERVTVVIRDRGAGFDMAAIAADRKGVRESVIKRLSRNGGDARVLTTPGEGTKVTLVLPRVES